MDLNDAAWQEQHMRLEHAWRVCHDTANAWAMRIATKCAAGETPTPDDLTRFREAQDTARIAWASYQGAL